MFTGLIEETGILKKIKPTGAGLSMAVSCHKILEDTKNGDSISINGICLTVRQIGDGYLEFDVSPETIKRSTISQWKTGDEVNLERAALPTTRLGGHIVQGHIDCTSEVKEVCSAGGFWLFKFIYPEKIGRYLVEKGSIAIDGISLTIAAIEDDVFTAAVIPETYQITTMKKYRKGTSVNIEVDILAKYIDKMNSTPKEKESSKLTKEKLKDLGY